MKKGLIGSIYPQRLAWFSVLVMIAGLLFAKSLLSIGMVSLFALAVLNPNVGTHVRVYFKSPVLWGFSLLFLIYLISGLYSENYHDWWERVNSRFPFVLLPFGFIVLRNQPKSSLNWLLYLFFWLTAGVCVFVLTRYLLNFDRINVNYSMGQVMETPNDHIRFSLLVCFAILTGGYLFWNRFQPLFHGERWLILGFTVALGLFIHVLAVRSGLLALYLSVVFLVIRYGIMKKRWLIMSTAMLLLFIGPILAYTMLPSFREKINYARWDLQNFFMDSKQAGLSDAARLKSLKTAALIGRQHPIMGVGAGDMQAEVDKYYSDHSEISPASRRPHNEFLWIFVSTGVVGLVIFWWSMFLPLFYNRNYRFPLMVCLYIIIVSSFLTEATIEGEVGACFYLVFALLFHNRLSSPHD